jgi:hypothetical protein
MVNRFLDWISELQCGVDLMTQQHYQAPKNNSLTLLAGNRVVGL